MTIGEHFILVSNTTATPAMAPDVITRIRAISDKPIKHVLLNRHHAVRVLGARAFGSEGATEVIASQGTYELIVERFPSAASQRRERARPDLANPGG